MIDRVGQLYLQHENNTIYLVVSLHKAHLDRYWQVVNLETMRCVMVPEWHIIDDWYWRCLS